MGEGVWIYDLPPNGRILKVFPVKELVLSRPRAAWKKDAKSNATTTNHVDIMSNIWRKSGESKAFSLFFIIVQMIVQDLMDQKSL